MSEYLKLCKRLPAWDHSEIYKQKQQLALLFLCISHAVTQMGQSWNQLVEEMKLWENWEYPLVN